MYGFLRKIIFRHKNLLKFLNENKKRMYQLYQDIYIISTYAYLHHYHEQNLVKTACPI